MWQMSVRHVRPFDLLVSKSVIGDESDIQYPTVTKSKTSECPCESGCPLGCENCSNPICKTKKVLAFSNGSISREMILDFQGLSLIIRC